MLILEEYLDIIKNAPDNAEEIAKVFTILSDEIEALEERIKNLEDINKLINTTVLKMPTTNNFKIEDGIPNCCKNCSNHPSNGGNGICNCTLPYFEDPIKWSIQGNMTIGDWAELAGNTKYVNILEVLGEENHED